MIEVKQPLCDRCGEPYDSLSLHVCVGGDDAKAVKSCLPEISDLKAKLAERDKLLEKVREALEPFNDSPIWKIKSQYERICPYCLKSFGRETPTATEHYKKCAYRRAAEALQAIREASE